MEILHIVTITVLVSGATAWLLWEFWGNLRGSREPIERTDCTIDAIPPWLARGHGEARQPTDGTVAPSSGRMAATPFPNLEARELPVFARTARPQAAAGKTLEPQRLRQGRGGTRPSRLIA